MGTSLSIETETGEITTNLSDILNLLIKELSKTYDRPSANPLSLINPFVSKNQEFLDGIDRVIEETNAINNDLPAVLVKRIIFNNNKDILNQIIETMNTYMATLSTDLTRYSTTIATYKEMLSNIETLLGNMNPADLIALKNSIKTQLAAHLLNINKKASKSILLNGIKLDGNIILTKDDIGLGNVLNAASLYREKGDFTTFPIKQVPSQEDRLLIEDETGSKTVITVGELPLSAVGYSEFDNLVNNTTVINSNPLTDDVVLTKESIGLDRVENVNPRPLSVLAETALEQKDDVINVQGSTTGTSSDILQIEYDSGGHVINTLSVPCTIQGNGTISGLDNVQDVDTTNADNVFLDGPITVTVGPIETSNTLHRGLNKAQTALDNKTRYTWAQDELFVQVDSDTIGPSGIVFGDVGDTSIMRADSVLQYLDNKLVDALNVRGNHDASPNTFPTDTDIKENDAWIISVAGELNGGQVNIGSIIYAITDDPTTSDWEVIVRLASYIYEDSKNKVDVLIPPSDVSYISSGGLKEVVDNKLTELEPLFPSGTIDDIILSDKTIVPLDKSVFGLDNVKNEEQIVKERNVFNLLPAQTPVNVQDVVIVEDSLDSYNKKYVAVSGVSTSSQLQEELSGYVPKTRTVNTVPLDVSTVVIDKAHLDLGAVDNTSDLDKPVSVIQTTALNTLVDKHTITGGVVGGVNYVPQITINSNGLITASAHIGLNVSPTESNLDQVVNIDTTTQKNVIIKTPLFNGASGDITDGDSGHAAFSKLQSQLNTKPGLINGLENEYIVSDISGGYISSAKSVNNELVGEGIIWTAAGVASRLAAASIGVLKYRGEYDASGGVYPVSGGSGPAGTIHKGDQWIVSDSGVLGTTVVSLGDSLIAKTSSPGSDSANWIVLQTNLPYIQESTTNKKTLALTNSDTHYPSCNLVKTAIDSAVSSKQARIDPATGNVYFSGNHTYELFSKELVGLSNVLNIKQLEKADNKFIIHPEKTTVTSNDIIVIEDSEAGYTKKRVLLSTLPTSSSSNADAASKVNKTTTINGIPINDGLVLTKTDFGLDQVDNTSAMTKPISTQLQTALDDCVPSSRTVNLKPLTSNVTLTASDFGFSSVDNTSDSMKPVSGPMQTAFNTKYTKPVVFVAGNLVADGGNGSIVDTGYKVSHTAVGNGIVPTAARVMSMKDSFTDGVLVYAGIYDASSGIFPSSDNKGQFWEISVPGTIDIYELKAGDVLISVVDSPSDSSDWKVIKTSVSYPPEVTTNKEATNMTVSSVKYPGTEVVLAYVVTETVNMQSTGTGIENNIPRYTATGGIEGSVYKVVTPFTASNTSIGTSADIKGQLDYKEPNITGACTSVISSNLPPNQLLVTDAQGKISSVAADNIQYLTGLNDVIATQISGKEYKFIVVNNEAVMLALPDTLGLNAVRVDLNNRIMRLSSLPASAASNWKSPAGNTYVDTSIYGQLPTKTDLKYNEFKTYLSYNQRFTSEITHRQYQLIKPAMVDEAYYGGCYDPSNDRIYFAPYNEDGRIHYIDCHTGFMSNIVFSPLLSQPNAFKGMVYSPVSNKLFLIPFSTYSLAAWYYIDCVTNTLTTYTRGPSVLTGGFNGGCYHPVLDRIYLSPDTSDSKFYYIDCSMLSVVETAQASMPACTSCVYAIGNNSVYYVPKQNTSTWLVLSGPSAVTNILPSPTTTTTYSGAVYSPTSHRVYLTNSVSPNTFQYIDCQSNTVSTYTPPAGLSTGLYQGGCYCPSNNIVYFTPDSAGSDSVLLAYNDTSNASITYTNKPTTLRGKGAVYCPIMDRVYFAPYLGVVGTNWFYIECYSTYMSKLIQTYIGNSCGL